MSAHALHPGTRRDRPPAAGAPAPSAVAVPTPRGTFTRSLRTELPAFVLTVGVAAAAAAGTAAWLVENLHVLSSGF